MGGQETRKALLVVRFLAVQQILSMVLATVITCRTTARMQAVIDPKAGQAGTEGSRQVNLPIQYFCG
jgi:hypothetical protein